MAEPPIVSSGDPLYGNGMSLSCRLTVACYVSLASAFLLLPLIVPIAADGVQVVPLEQAMQRAAEASPIVQQAEARAKQLDRRRVRARSAYFPSLGSNTHSDEFESGAEDSVTEESRFEDPEGFRLEQPIFDRQGLTSYRATRLLQQSYQQQAKALSMDASLRAGLTYLSYLQAWQRQQLTEQYQALARRHQAFAHSRLLRGVGQADEAALWERRQEELEQAVSSAAAEARRQRQRLLRLLDWSDDFRWIAVPRELAAGETAFLDERLRDFFASETAFEGFRDQARKWALSQAPNLVQLRHQLAAQQVVLDPPWYLRWPTLSSYASYNSGISVTGAGSGAADTDTFSDSVLDEANWTAGLQLSVSIGHQEYPHLQSANLDLQTRQIELADDLERLLEAELDRLWETWTERGQSNAAAEAAWERFQALRDTYLAGETGAAELSTAQQASREAELALSDARHDYLQALLRYQRAIGWFAYEQGPKAIDRFVESVKAIP